MACHDKRHPVLEDLCLQHPKCDETLAQLAFIVYQDLTEVHGWWFTRLRFSPPLGRPYVVGQRDQTTPRQVALPLRADEVLTPAQLQKFCTHILVNEESVKSVFENMDGRARLKNWSLYPKFLALTLGDHRPLEKFYNIVCFSQLSVLAAIIEGDTTVVFYTLTSGLCPPDPPERVEQRKAEKEQRMERKRRRVAAYLRKASVRRSSNAT